MTDSSLLKFSKIKIWFAVRSILKVLLLSLSTEPPYQNYETSRKIKGNWSIVGVRTGGTYELCLFNPDEWITRYVEFMEYPTKQEIKHAVSILAHGSD